MFLPENRQPILVTGAAGMLGHYFQGPRYVPTGKAILDVRDAHQIDAVLRSRKFSLVVHLAALTDVDRCEEDPDLAWQTNHMGTRQVVEACARYHLPMIYISTAAVFSGNPKRFYTEHDHPEPTSVYAQTKWAGEESVRRTLKAHWIVRIGWLMGGCKRDHKFVGQMLRKMEAPALSQQEPTQIPVVTDTLGSLLYGFDLKQTLWPLVRQRAYGTFHISNQGICSRWEIALELSREMGRKPAIQWVPISSASFPVRVSRPASEVLVDTRTRAFGLQPLRSWNAALRDYLSEWSQAG